MEGTVAWWAARVRSISWKQNMQNPERFQHIPLLQLPSSHYRQTPLELLGYGPPHSKSKAFLSTWLLPVRSYIKQISRDNPNPSSLQEPFFLFFHPSITARHFWKLEKQWCSSLRFSSLWCDGYHYVNDFFFFPPPQTDMFSIPQILSAGVGAVSDGRTELTYKGESIWCLLFWNL